MKHLLSDSPEVLRSFSKQAADLPDLLQGRNHPLIVRPKLLDEPIDPLHLLRVSVLYDSRKVSYSTQVHAGNDVALSSELDLRAAVVQDLDVGTQGLVHDVHRHVVTVSQVPQQVEHFVSHHSILIVLRQPADQLQELLPLLFTRVRPTRLPEREHRDQSQAVVRLSTTLSLQTVLRYLETVEQVVELLRGKVPRQLCQQIVDVLDDRFMFSSLRTHDRGDQ